MTNKIRYRAIDRRNRLYDSYKYQLQVNNICGYIRMTTLDPSSHYTLRVSVLTWLTKTYGAEYGSGMARSEYWCYVSKPYGTDLIYLKDNDVLSQFLLKWS